jgi:hypothetical protein
MTTDDDDSAWKAGVSSGREGVWPLGMRAVTSASWLLDSLYTPDELTQQLRECLAEARALLPAEPDFAVVLLLHALASIAVELAESYAQLAGVPRTHVLSMVGQSVEKAVQEVVEAEGEHGNDDDGA